MAALLSQAIQFVISDIYSMLNNNAEQLFIQLFILLFIQSFIIRLIKAFEYRKLHVIPPSSWKKDIN